MKVRSRRDNFYRVILFGGIFICFVPMFLLYLQNGFTTQFFVGQLIIMAVAGLLLWIWDHTYYQITPTHLKFFSGPFRGKMEIGDITEITINKTLYAGLKYGLARNGLIIESTSHLKLYISPKNPRDFIEILVKANPSIKLKA